MVEEAVAYVQGRSLKATATLLREVYELPDHQVGGWMDSDAEKGARSSVGTMALVKSGLALAFVLSFPAMFIWSANKSEEEAEPRQRRSFTTSWCQRTAEPYLVGRPYKGHCTTLATPKESSKYLGGRNLSQRRTRWLCHPSHLLSCAYRC